MNEEHLFNYDNELVSYTRKEIMKYVNEYNPERVLYHYNRMTINELTQEVLLKVFKSNQGKINKAYVRKAIMCVCIDNYRRTSDLDLGIVTGNDISDECVQLEDLYLTIDDNTLFESIHLLSELKHFEGKELDIFSLALQGFRGQEIFTKLGIPHRTYYTLLASLRDKAIES